MKENVRFQRWKVRRSPKRSTMCIHPLMLFRLATRKRIPFWSLQNLVKWLLWVNSRRCVAMDARLNSLWTKRLSPPKWALWRQYVFGALFSVDRESLYQQPECTSRIPNRNRKDACSPVFVSFVAKESSGEEWGPHERKVSLWELDSFLSHLHFIKR